MKRKNPPRFVFDWVDYAIFAATIVFILAWLPWENWIGGLLWH